MILEIEHHLRLDATCQNQNLGKTCWQKKTLLAEAISIWLSERCKQPNNQPHTGT